MSIIRRLAWPLALATAIGSPVAAQAQGEVNIYSYREPALIEPLLKAFTTNTGIKTNIVFANAGLVERLAAEGRNSPADILLTADVGFLVQAKEAGLTQPITGTGLNVVPAALRDPAGHWTGLTVRARVLYVSRERVRNDSISYEDLAGPAWKGKICSRSGQHPYNTALLASIIAHKGEAAAEAWAKGVRANLARKPAGGDREGVRDVQSGRCDVAIGNTYYMAAMLSNPDQKSWAEATRIVFPNSADRGTHVNVSGVAVTANAPNKANAAKLVDFLLSDQGQGLYASANSEYPVNPAIPYSDLLKSWGEFKADTLPIENIARFRKKASEIMDRVGFDQGPSN